MKFDVIVIGGGPAGAAASITLCKFTRLKVALLEAGNGGQSSKLGETTSPAIGPILEYLDAQETFRKEDHAPWNSMKAAWGNSQLTERNFIFTGRGSGWHLNRTSFDRGLLDVAGNKGVEVFFNTPVRVIKDLGDEWLIITDSKTGRQNYFCKYIIDASGRKSVLSRLLRLEQKVIDRLACYMMVFKVETATIGEITTETTSDGWWYSTTLPEKRVALAFMTDVDIAKSKGYNRLNVWGEHLCHTIHIYPIIENAVPEGDLIIRAANTRYLTKVSGKNWISAGESSISFDPISSMGIGYALSSGIQAGRLCQAMFNDPDFDHSQYKQDIENHFREYFGLYLEFYGQEKRWREEVFWKRRQQDISHFLNDLDS